MKKFLVIAAALLMMGVAAQANAAFSNGDLIQVSYDTSTGVEIATDLGTVSSLTSVSNDTNTIALSAFGTTATWSQVQTAYFTETAGSATYPNTVYIAATTTPTDVTRKGNAVTGNMASVLGYYIGLGTGAQVTAATSNANSFYTLLGNAGWAGFLSSSGDPYGTLANNATNNTQLLYSWALSSNTNSAVAGTLAGITIDTYEGVTTINPESGATPIPPSVLLMGSGLLGLVGIGRRKFFA